MPTDACILTCNRGDSKELAIKQVVVPMSKIRKSDKVFLGSFGKKFAPGFLSEKFTQIDDGATSFITLFGRGHK